MSVPDNDMIAGIFSGKVITVEHGKVVAIYAFFFPPPFFASWPISTPGGGMTCGLRLPSIALLAGGVDCGSKAVTQ